MINSHPTLNEYFIFLEKERRGTVKISTERTVRERFKNISGFIPEASKKTLGETELQKITRYEILSLKQSLSERLCSSTTNASIGLLRSILNDAVNDRIIGINPCNGIKALKRREEKPGNTIHRALSIKETEVFFECASGSRYLNLFKILILTGLRCGEAGALKKRDISEGVLRVRRTVIKAAGGLRISDCPKTASGNRNIPITKGIGSVLSDQLKKAEEYCSETLFFSRYGGLISSDYINKEIKGICKTAGIEPFTAHAFRDTFATRAIESGMNVKTLQEILGHSSYGITMSLYVHVMPETKRREMEMVKTGI